MGMSIQTNLGALNAQRNILNSESMLNSSLAKLSSGYRITKAGDDAAGLALSSQLTADYKSYNQAARNALDGQSLIQTAESAMNETQNILVRFRELAMQSANDTTGTNGRTNIQLEVVQLIQEMDRIAAATTFNGSTLIDGTGTTLSFQVGIGSNAGVDNIDVDMSGIDVTSAGLGMDTLDLGTDAATSQAALADIDQAISDLAGFRATLGAVGNRFESVVNTARVGAESVAATNSRIRDVDVAQETSNLAKNQILVQAGVSVLAQANQMSQVALKLLG